MSLSHKRQTKDTIKIVSFRFIFFEYFADQQENFSFYFNINKCGENFIVFSQMFKREAQFRFHLNSQIVSGLIDSIFDYITDSWNNTIQQ